MELYSAADRQKIEKVNGVVRPLIERLVQATRDKGINQNDLFAFYPIYVESNRIKNELRRMVLYAPNSERIQELQLKCEQALDQTRKCTRGDLYELFQPLLASTDYELMASIVAKCLSAAFQAQIEDKQSERSYLLGEIWKEIEQKQKREDTRRFTRDMNDNFKYDFQLKLARLYESIEKRRIISMDVIWRELQLLFTQRPNDHKLVGDKFADLLSKGQPFEVIDGDNFHFNDKFLKEMFEVQQKQQLRIRVISILGPQNSGKSTLLNFMFGCDFSVSEGRCTRGIYGSFVKATGESAKEFDYLLVLDTEGLQSLEESDRDREYHRMLIKFSFAVSNIVIIHNKDFITEKFRIELDVCLDSLRKIDCQRVHQPIVYLVLNQQVQARRHDVNPIFSLIERFKSNGLINQLSLDLGNSERLHYAFNLHSFRIKRNYQLHYRTTSSSYTENVFQLANTIIDLARKTEKDDAFSNITKWIQFSYFVFDIIINYPDITYFRKFDDRKEQQALQDFINEKLTSKLSHVMKETILDNAIKTQESKVMFKTDVNALSGIQEYISSVKNQLIKDLEDYSKTYRISAGITRFQQEFLVSQIDQIKDYWENELRIKINEANLRREVDTGEGKKHFLNNY